MWHCLNINETVSLSGQIERLTSRRPAGVHHRLETGIQSIKMKGKASRSTLEFWKKRHSIFNYCHFFFFFFFAATMKRKRVLKSRRKCDVLQLWVSGKPGKQLWNEADGLFIHSSSSQFQKKKTTFGILAYQREVANIQWKGQTTQ